ncbi:restriction endonuclease subunit S, partial [Brenneria populi]|nr:restriction endonuclease subunit S [Brenneria populi Li et al. 2015]
MTSKLSDLCDFADGRVVVAGLDLDTYISTENMLSNKEGITRSAGLPSISQTQAYQAKDVLLSNIRPYFRKIWFADRDGGCSNDVLVLRAKEKVYPGFLYYLLSDDSFFDYAMATAKGTKMPRGDKRAIMQYEVPDLPLDIQIGIADTLAVLDGRIAANRAINHHLEQIAQAIFKSWFVDFEPFGGKVPDDWRKGTIRDTCSAIYNGGTPRRNEPLFWNGSIPWLTSGEVRQSIITKPENCISEAGLKSSSAKWVPSFSTVVALYGATAGQVSMVATSLTTNQAICALVPKEHHAFYNYLVMQNSVAQLENKAIGSAQQNISKAIVEKTACLIADPNSITEFEKLVSPLFNKWIKSLFESAQLANLRDVLLPRLMSGE